MRNKRPELDYYNVQVKKMKYRNNDQFNNDDSVFLNEGDTLLAYSKHPPRVGKYMDLWFSSASYYEDKENYITLGRVTKVEPAREGNGLFVVTKLGRFILTGGACEVARNNHLQ